MHIWTGILIFGFFLFPFQGKSDEGAEGLSIQAESPLKFLNSAAGDSTGPFEGVNVTDSEKTEAQSDDDSRQRLDRCCNRDSKSDDWAQSLSPQERQRLLASALGASGSGQSPAPKKRPSARPHTGSKGQR